MLNKVIQYLESINNNTAHYVNNNFNLLQFNVDGLNYLAEYNSDDDPSYFRIMLPYIDSFNDEMTNDSMDKMLRISTSYKVGKVILIDRSVWLSAEIFIGDKSTASVILPRMVYLLRDMLNAYREDLTNER